MDKVDEELLKLQVKSHDNMLTAINQVLPLYQTQIAELRAQLTAATFACVVLLHCAADKQQAITLLRSTAANYPGPLEDCVMRIVQAAEGTVGEINAAIADLLRTAGGK